LGKQKSLIDVFGTNKINEIQIKLTDAIDVHYQENLSLEGIVICYRDEKTLFNDYTKLFIPLVHKKHVQFATWKGKASDGAVVKHPGQIKLNGIKGENYQLVHEKLKKALNIIFGEFHPMETFIVIKPDKSGNRGWENKKWLPS